MKKSTVSRMMALLLAVITVLSLTACGSKEDAPSNTIGNAVILMDEAKVDITGQTVFGLGASRVAHNKYKLVPGTRFSRDPIIHVSPDSAACWLFVDVQNGIESVEDPSMPIAAGLEANGWTLLDGTVYACNAVANPGDDVPLFKDFLIRADVTEDELKALENPEILLTPYAVEAEGYDTAEAAWAAFGA